jgi:mono/diheme cytochrome c family protein
MSTTTRPQQRTGRLVLGGAILTLLSLSLPLIPAGAQAQGQPAFGFGASPTPEELSRFVSPLPDGRGLPDGSGSAERGKAVYDTQCVACHGDQLQGGLGDRLIGGRDTLVQRDSVKGPVKTVESYWPYSTTLFDYIKRAMPLLEPGTMSNDDVYAVSAYILSKAGIVPADAVLDRQSLTRVQMPNRDGFIPDPRPEDFAKAR